MIEFNKEFDFAAFIKAAVAFHSDTNLRPPIDKWKTIQEGVRIYPAIVNDPATMKKFAVVSLAIEI